MCFVVLASLILVQVVMSGLLKIDGVYFVVGYLDLLVKEVVGSGCLVVVGVAAVSVRDSLKLTECYGLVDAVLA